MDRLAKKKKKKRNGRQWPGQMRLIWEKIGRPTPLTLLPSIRISARSANWFSINNAPDVTLSYAFLAQRIRISMVLWILKKGKGWNVSACIDRILGRGNLLSTLKIRSRVTGNLNRQFHSNSSSTKSHEISSIPFLTRKKGVFPFRQRFVSLS